MFVSTLARNVTIEKGCHEEIHLFFLGAISEATLDSRHLNLPKIKLEIVEAFRIVLKQNQAIINVFKMLLSLAEFDIY